MTGLPAVNLTLNWNAEAEGRRLHALAAELYPICRSITGNGVRRSLALLGQHVPVAIHELPSGTAVFDWVVPNEWNVRDAYIANASGDRVVDFRANSLHVLNYSMPVRRRMALAELRPHLFTRTDAPGWIPYRTSYYSERWGFCLSHQQLEALPDGEYDVCIDSTLAPGHLTYGEIRLQGRTDEEVVVSAHCCHPSLANDNLSGMVVAAGLAAHLAGVDLHHSYRFLWMPGTIGAIAWLATHEAVLPLVKHGLVLSCLGDPGRFTYKRSRQGCAAIDRVAEHVLARSCEPFTVRDFTPLGYDERQFCSPGIDLPFGCLMRTPHGEFPEYHTSADDLSFITRAALAGSLLRLLQIAQVLELERRYVNLQPKCEPQLGRRGLYRSVGGTGGDDLEAAMLWVLNFSDGHHGLLDIAERSGLPITSLARAAVQLASHGLLAPFE